MTAENPVAYQPIESFDFIAFVVVVGLALLITAPVLISVGIQHKDRRLVLGGAASAVLLLLVVGLGFSPAKAHQDERFSVMKSNILQKYNTKFHPDYLQSVEFEDDEGRGKKGNYFIVTYEDFSTERILFHFNSKTGEPRCDCELEE